MLFLEFWVTLLKLVLRKNKNGWQQFWKGREKQSSKQSPMQMFHWGVPCALSGGPSVSLHFKMPSVATILGWLCLCLLELNLNDSCFFKYQNPPFNPNYCFVSFSFYITESTVFEAIISFIFTSSQVNKSIFTFCISMSSERHKVTLIYFLQNVSPKSSATDN